MTSIGSSGGPNTTLTVSVTSRRKRQPRKLNFLSCTFCRKSKVKCLPVGRASTNDRCTRCRERDLACSAPQRKNATGALHLPSDDAVTDSGSHEASINLETHDALALLSLQHILDIAVDELTIVGKDLLSPLEDHGTWASHVNDRDKVISSYRGMIDVIRAKLKRAANATAQAILTATLDISYIPRFVNDARSMEELDRTLSLYAKEGHHGIATVLQMRRLQYDWGHTEGDIQDMMLDRDAFIESLSGVIERQNLKEVIWIDLTETQLFTPAALFHIPALVQAVLEDGRKDCLLRPIGHVFHDNKVVGNFDTSAHEDGLDILGRSKLHLAREPILSDKTLLALAEVPAWHWHAVTTLGLSPLHLAAIHGDEALFKIALNSSENANAWLKIRSSSPTERTYLHWAACFGNIGFVKGLLTIYASLGSDHSCLVDLLARRDYRDDTALHLAARIGCTDVVKELLGAIDSDTMEQICLRHTPFWAAVTGSSLEVMELLGLVSKVDEPQHNMTPLAEAARQGFTAGVAYLLNRRDVMVNSINFPSDGEAQGQLPMTPLDIAVKEDHADCVDLLWTHGALPAQELDLT